MSITEKLNFLSQHTSNIARCGDTQDIVCSFLGNKWSKDFVEKHKFNNFNLSDFYIQGGGCVKMFHIDSLNKVFNYQKGNNGYQQVLTEFTVVTFIDYLKTILEIHTFIGISIDNNNIEHAFVLYQEDNQLFIADSYMNIRGLKIRLFDMNQFQGLLINPNTEKYNDLFKCQEHDNFSHSITIDFNLYSINGPIDNIYNILTW